MKDYRELIDPSNIPKHIGIIMDGNGRWAVRRSLPRSEGHKKGSDAIEPIMRACIDLGIKAVSLYAFSLENWGRPKPEVAGLWKLFEYFFNTKLDSIIQNEIKVIHAGTENRLPASVKKCFNDAITKTAGNKKIILNLCINYGGRQEIIAGVNRWLAEKKQSEQLTAKKLSKYLYTAALPEVDLIIRTSGEYRISNFMLWQLAYAELFFIDTLWPDFTPSHLYKTIYDYQQRKRRFGNI